MGKLDSFLSTENIFEKQYVTVITKEERYCWEVCERKQISMGKLRQGAERVLVLMEAH